MLRVGDLIDLDEVARDLVAAGYQRIDQVEERGQFAIRGGLLDVYPATEERAVRVDLFDIEIEALRWFSTFTQRSLGETDCVEISPAAELAPEHREMAEIAASDAPEDRPDIAELLPVEQFRALLDIIPERTQIIVAAEEDVEPTLRDHWEDVCAAFDDQDARDLYVNPTKINEALAERAEARLSSISQDQPIKIRAQAADFAARNMHEAESELEKLVRSDYTTVVAWPQIGAAERAAYNLDRIKASLNGGAQGPDLHRGQPARRLRRARASSSPRSPSTGSSTARRPPRGRRARAAACCAASPTCARATSSSTRTTASRASPASTPRPSPASRATT